MIRNNATMAPTNSAPRAVNRIALNREILRQVNGLHGLVKLRRNAKVNEDAAACAAAIEAILQSLNALQAEADEVEARIAAAPPANGCEEAHGRALCVRCRRIITRSAADMESYIADAAASAAWSNWPKDLFMGKMRAVLQPGDEIAFVRAGAVLVRRKDGSTMTVWRYGG